MKALYISRLCRNLYERRCLVALLRGSSFSLIDNRKIIAYVTGRSVTDIYYITRKETGNDKAKLFLLDLIKTVPVLGVDQNIIEKALFSDFKDFEDAVQAYTSSEHCLKYIITRNKQDFIRAQLKVFTPEEALVYFSKDTK